uniref:Transmembrane protein n=1 Tax=Elaeophora elaphi TaxID=1147741 RepID=A0A0R3RPF7_9BILA
MRLIHFQSLFIPRTLLMWLFLLTLLLGILPNSNIHVQSWQCYDLLKQCTSSNDSFLDINRINSSTINYFCESYTYSIIPCLAGEMKEKPGVTYRDRFLILRECVENDRSEQNNSENTMNAIKILRLYLYSCIYNNMADMSQDSCFSKLVRNCVEKSPTTRKCYYWSCKNENFLTLKRSNVFLPQEALENDDDGNLIGIQFEKKSSIRK